MQCNRLLVPAQNAFDIRDTEVYAKYDVFIINL